jgi:hypothetical protein
MHAAFWADHSGEEGAQITQHRFDTRRALQAEQGCLMFRLAIPIIIIILLPQNQNHPQVQALQFTGLFSPCAVCRSSSYRIPIRVEHDAPWESQAAP